MKKWTRVERVEAALSDLFQLQYHYSNGEGFNMDIYHRIEKQLDQLRSEEVGEVLTKTYPNPCSEILLAPVESPYREEQRRWRKAGFNAYNCDMVDEFPTW